MYLHKGKAEFPTFVFLKSRGHGRVKCSINKGERKVVKGVSELHCSALFWYCTFLGMAAHFLSLKQIF